MKKIKMFYLESCPHCINASNLTAELISENPRYGELEIEKIEESKNPEIADSYDYYYVPTYFVDEMKIHEGVPTKEAIKKVFDVALA